MDSKLQESDVAVTDPQGYVSMYHRKDRFELPKEWRQGVEEVLIYMAKDFGAVIISRPENVSEGVRLIAQERKVTSWNQIHIPYEYTNILINRRCLGRFFYSQQDDGSLALIWRKNTG